MSRRFDAIDIRITRERLSFGLVGPDVSMPVLAAWEVVVRLGLLNARFLRATLLLLALQIAGAASLSCSLVRRWSLARRFAAARSSPSRNGIPNDSHGLAPIVSCQAWSAMQMTGSSLSEDRCETECIHPEQVRPLLGRTLSAEGALRVGDLFGLLADPTRARILHALTLTDELCVCDLALLLGLSVSGLSHQLRLLRDRDAVARRKAGRIVYYRLADEHVRRVLTDAIVHVGEGAPLEVPG